ncbi:MAG: hypothetical protein Q4A07_10265 [Coriobacteriales bacterium]|nr:hypothetical protein [Coriobacteriales bacterium]
MEMLIAIVKLVTAILVLTTAIIKLMSEAEGSNNREDKKEGH